jgi:hypothetical protein
VGLYRYFNEYRSLPMRPQSLADKNPHVFKFKKDTEDVSGVMLKHCGPKPIFYCPDNPENRDAGAWWPFRSGTIAVTYQFPFWMTPQSWLIAYPDYRRLHADRVLSGDYVVSSDGLKQVIAANHVNSKGIPRGMNILFGDGRVVWNDARGGWVTYAVYDAREYWHYAQPY